MIKPKISLFVKYLTDEMHGVARRFRWIPLPLLADTTNRGPCLGGPGV
jgi:hypothetical protein